MIQNKIARIKTIQISTYFAIGAISIALAYKNRTNGAVSLIFDKSDIYMDLVNTIFDSCRPDAYSSLGNVYPPALMGMLRTVFTSYCNEGLSSAKQLRTEILDALMLSHFILIFLSGFMLGRITWALRKDRIIACTAAIIGAAWSPLIFGIDRMNLILVPYYILLLSVSISIGPARKGNEKIATWNNCIYWTTLLAVLVKPYFIVIFGLVFAFEYMGCRKSISSRLILSLKYGLSLLIMYLINMQPFIAETYDGTILSWLNNLFSFQGIFSSNPSNIWNMNYYSLSTFAASKLIPAATMPEFLNHPVVGNNLAISTIGLGIQIIFSISMLYFLYKKIRVNYLHKYIYNASSKIMAELSVITISIILMSSLATSFGYYTGIFWVILVVNALCFSSREESIIIANLSFLFIVTSSSSTNIWPSSSIPATTCLYILMTFSASTIVKKLEAQASDLL